MAKLLAQRSRRRVVGAAPRQHSQYRDLAAGRLVPTPALSGETLASCVTPGPHASRPAVRITPGRNASSPSRMTRGWNRRCASRCLQPGQQQGRRIPSSSSSWVRRISRCRGARRAGRRAARAPCRREASPRPSIQPCLTWVVGAVPLDPAEDRDTGELREASPIPSLRSPGPGRAPKEGGARPWLGVNAASGSSGGGRPADF